MIFNSLTGRGTVPRLPFRRTEMETATYRTLRNFLNWRVRCELRNYGTGTAIERAVRAMVDIRKIYYRSK